MKSIREKQIPLPFLDSPLAKKVMDYAGKGIEGTENTQCAYQTDITHFRKWCKANQCLSLPVSVSTLATYVVSLAESHKWATINRRLAAIRKWHELSDQEIPIKDKSFRAVMEGIKRMKGVRQQQAPAPAFQLKELKTFCEVSTPRLMSDYVISA